MAIELSASAVALPGPELYWDDDNVVWLKDDVRTFALLEVLDVEWQLGLGAVGHGAEDMDIFSVGKVVETTALKDGPIGRELLAVGQAVASRFLHLAGHVDEVCGT